MIGNGNEIEVVSTYLHI